MKARARALRWEEELALIPEEVRRTIEYFEWHATDWEKRAAARGDVTPQLREGLAAYAARQASLRRGYAQRCRTLWQKVLAGGDVDGEDQAHAESGDSGDSAGAGEDADSEAVEDGAVDTDEPEDVLAYLEIDNDEFV